jgi:hypothetical protein
MTHEQPHDSLHLLARGRTPPEAVRYQCDCCGGQFVVEAELGVPLDDGRSFWLCPRCGAPSAATASLHPGTTDDPESTAPASP